MAGLNIYSPVQSLEQPTKRSGPQGNIHKGRDVNIGRIQGQFEGGPAIESALGGGRGHAGLAGLARGLDKWAAVLEEQERDNQTFEAMEEVNAFKDRQRAMFEQMDQMKGKSGITSPYLAEEFYNKERKYFEEKGRGDFQKMMYTRLLDSEEDQGLGRAMGHRTQELDRYEKSAMAGDQAQFDMIANDLNSSPEDVAQAAIPLVQRQRAYFQKQGLDPRAAAIETNNMFRQGMLTNATNRLMAGGDPVEIQRGISGLPASVRLPQNVSALADQVGAAQGVDPALLKSIIMAESSGDPRAVSGAGARGLMQLMPDTARDMGVNPDDPEQNVRGGAEYISQMLKKYNGNLKHALMAYNWGPGNFDRWLQRGGKDQVPGETQKYVRKVMADYQMQKGGGRAGGGLVRPLAGDVRISSGFGPRKAPRTPNGPGSSDHKGIDYAVPVGTPVASAGAGTVDFVGRNGGYGLQVRIDHGNGRVSWYSHLSDAGGLKKGDVVSQGQQLALSGGAKGDPNAGKSTGPHLDFKVSENGEFVDPEAIFQGGQDQQVMLAGNSLTMPGDVVSDAYGVAAPNNNVEAAMEMAMPTAEINPGSSGDWILADDAAVFNAFATDADRQKLWSDWNKIQDSQIKERNRAINAKYEEMDFAGSLAEADLLSDPDFQELSYDERLGWLKVARGEAGRMGQVRSDIDAANAEAKTAAKTRLESDFFSSAEIGAIPRTKDGLTNWYAENKGWDYFTRSDFDQHMTFLEKEAGRVNTEIKNYMALNPDKFRKSFKYSQSEKEHIFLLKAAAMANEHQYTAGNDKLPGLLEHMAEGDRYLEPGYTAPGPFSAQNANVRESLKKDLLRRNNAVATPVTLWRANKSIDTGTPFDQIMAQGSEDWAGKGKVTLDVIARKLYVQKDLFEEAGNSYNVDPNFLIAIADVVSGGDKLAASKLTPAGVGLMQIDVEVAEQMGLKQETMFDPRRNIMASAAYFSRLLDETGGNYPKALAMYATGMPQDEIPKFLKEVQRVHTNNHGLKMPWGISNRRYQLPNYKMEATNGN